MEPGKLFYMRSLTLLAFRVQGPYSTSVHEAWGRMLTWLDELGVRARTQRGFGLFRDDPRSVSAESCHYDACVEIPEGIGEGPLDGMRLLSMPAGVFSRHEHTGDYRAMGATLTHIRNHWLSEQGLLLDSKRPVVAIYLRDPGRKPVRELKAQLCFPVIPPTHTSGRLVA